MDTCSVEVVRTREFGIAIPDSPHLNLLPAHVEDALTSVLKASPLHPENPLLRCEIVNKKYYSMAYLKGDYAQLHAVYLTLEESFQAVLGQKNLLENSLASCYFQSENQYILMYKLMYCRYMCPQLDLTTEKLSKITGYVSRTIRRKLKDGIGYLTIDLIKRELDTRKLSHALFSSHHASGDMFPSGFG